MTAAPHNPPRWRRWAGWLARLSLAAIGIAFIAVSMSWSDHVVMPAGWQTANGATLTEPIARPVIESRDDTLLVEPLRPGGDPLRLSRSELTASADTPHVEPGIITLVENANWAQLAFGLGLFGTIFIFQHARWLTLMRCRGLNVSLRRGFRLIMVGQFFNICLPGATGGDVVRAYYAAKGSDQRSRAVMSVVFDRISGLLGMILLAALTGLMLLDHPIVRWITLGLWVGLTSLAVLWAAYCSRRLRGWISGRLRARSYPGRSAVRTLDQAAVAYGDHKRAVAAAIGISLLAHICQAGSVAIAGYALGLNARLELLLTVLPIAFLAGSLPLTPLGLGVIEGVGLAILTATAGSDPTLVLGMFLGMRVYQIFYGLVGSLAMLGGDIQLHPAQSEADAQAMDEAQASHEPEGSAPVRG